MRALALRVLAAPFEAMRGFGPVTDGLELVQRVLDGELGPVDVSGLEFNLKAVEELVAEDSMRGAGARLALRRGGGKARLAAMRATAAHMMAQSEWGSAVAQAEA